MKKWKIMEDMVKKRRRDNQTWEEIEKYLQELGLLEGGSPKELFQDLKDMEEKVLFQMLQLSISKYGVDTTMATLWKAAVEGKIPFDVPSIATRLLPE